MTLTPMHLRGVGVILCKTLDHYLSSVKVSNSSIKGLRRFGSLKNFNQKHPDADTRVTSIAQGVWGGTV